MQFPAVFEVCTVVNVKDPCVCFTRQWDISRLYVLYLCGYVSAVESHVTRYDEPVIEATFLVKSLSLSLS